MKNFFIILNVILGSILLIALLNWVYYYIVGKRSAKIISQDEFRENMRKGQLIDVRERADYDAGHIMSARSIPFSTLNNALAAIRKDQPIYLYDSRRTLSIRAANKLRKKGYIDIYILKEGYDGWNGKKKIKKGI